MRSKTSFFNRTLCLSAVRRFWPLWTGYFCILFLTLPLPLYRMAGLSGYDYRSYGFFMQVCGAARTEGVILGAIVSVFSAMAVWSFLYNARSASGYGCLPVRREGQFFSALLAGFLPLAAANLLAAVLCLPVCISGGLSPLPLLYGFLILTLPELFFYGFATLCAFLTGHILVLPAVYAVLNFVAVVVEFLLRTVLGRFVYGLDSGDALDNLSCLWLSPPVGLLVGTDARVVYATTPAADGGQSMVPSGAAFSGWGCLLAYALAGLICMALALLLFRRRKLESAGDVVAVGFLRPVFRWCMALGCGLVLACFMEFVIFSVGQYERSAFLTLLIFFLLGAFIGWFAGEMLIQKSFRVFKRRAWGGFGLCCAVILVLMLGMRFDLFGYERRVPKAENIRSATVYANGSTSTLTRGEELAALTELHRAIIADKDRQLERFYSAGYGHWTALGCRITYSLNNGRVMTRYYMLYADPADLSETAQGLQDLMNGREAILSRNTPEVPLERENILYAYINVYMTLPECAALQGSADPEEYLLTEYGGYSPKEVRSMEPERRRQEAEAVLNHASGYAYEYFAGWKEGEYTGPRDLEGVYVNYSLGLDAREAAELYRDCLQPDLEEGNLGEIRLFPNRDQDEAQYSASAVIYYEYVDEYGNTRDRDLSLSPGLRSARTNAWLRGRGLVLHTVGEVNAAMARSEMSRALSD